MKSPMLKKGRIFELLMQIPDFSEDDHNVYYKRENYTYAISKDEIEDKNISFFDLYLLVDEDIENCMGLSDELRQTYATYLDLLIDKDKKEYYYSRIGIYRNGNKFLKIGGHLEELFEKPGWSEDDDNVYFKLDHYNFLISKETINEKYLNDEDIIDRLKEDALAKGLEVYFMYEDLPFAHLLESENEQHLANYLLNGNPDFTYDLIKEEGMDGLYMLISNNAINAYWLEKDLIAEGEAMRMHDALHEELYRGVPIMVPDYTQPLILDFKYKPFTLHDGVIEYTV